MKCPRCGSDRNSVMDVKNSCANTHRKRKCKDCKYIFYTYEHPMPDEKEYLAAVRRYNRSKKDDKN